jgi:predicted porin
MKSGLKLSTAAVALLTVVGMGMAPASAADLGGDCCADLEERIAELEATTARKGNRKVKLEVSGQVNEAIIFWDDGFESNAGVYTNDASRTRFRFRGDAAVADGWKAGYLLEVGVRSQNSKRFNQDQPAATGGDNGFDLRHSVWYLDSKTFGRVWVGLTGGASESVTETDISGTNDVAKFADLEDLGGGLGLRRANGNYTRGAGGLISIDGATGTTNDVTLRRLIRDSGNQQGEGRRYNMVRYDTPTWEGFTGTVNWGADDAWEVGLKYKGEFAGLQVVGAIAYGDNSEPASTGAVIGFECLANRTLGRNVAGSGKDADCNQLGGSIGVLHEATGLYGKFAAGYLEDELVSAQNAAFDDRSEFYAGEVGLQQKWVPLGKTTVFGQYYVNEGGTNSGRTFGGTRTILNSEIEAYSIGVKQDVDSAAMSLYAIYRHVESEATFGNVDQANFAITAGDGRVQYEDIDLFMAGGIIKF